MKQFAKKELAAFNENDNKSVLVALSQKRAAKQQNGEGTLLSMVKDNQALSASIVSTKE